MRSTGIIDGLDSGTLTIDDGWLAEVGDCMGVSRTGGAAVSSPFSSIGSFPGTVLKRLNTSATGRKNRNENTRITAALAICAVNCPGSAGTPIGAMAPATP